MAVIVLSAGGGGRLMQACEADVHLALRLQSPAEGDGCLVSKAAPPTTAGIAASRSRGRVSLEGIPQGAVVCAVQVLRDEAGPAGLKETLPAVEQVPGSD